MLAGENDMWVLPEQEDFSGYALVGTKGLADPRRAPCHPLKHHRQEFSLPSLPSLGNHIAASEPQN